MSVIVIDQIMGSYKTTFAIEYMKSRPLENFMYITPYLEEIKRIKLATKDKKQFISPENKGSGKLESLKYLIRNEEDIASTHELFRHYDLETREELQRTKYTLILDEVLDVLEPYPIKKDDLKILKDSKCINIDEEGYVIWNNDYKDYDSEYNEIKNLSESHMLFFLKDTVLLWKYPPEIFDLFENVFILTYLFEGSIMKYYFDYHEIQYTKKCVSKQNNKYILCDFKRSNTSKYKELITIYDEPNKYKLFQKPSALSKNWFEQNKDKCNIFKNCCYNFFRHICKSSCNEVMWTTFKDFKYFTKPRSYTKGFVSFNCRSTNEYNNRKYLAYLVNIYPNPNIEVFFQSKNIIFNKDLYALSIFLQWIWRSQIRENKEIIIYIPSERMKNLLIKWLDNCF